MRMARSRLSGKICLKYVSEYFYADRCNDRVDISLPTQEEIVRSQ